MTAYGALFSCPILITDLLDMFINEVILGDKRYYATCSRFWQMSFILSIEIIIFNVFVKLAISNLNEY